MKNSQTKRPRYRYIRAGVVDFDDPVSSYRLVSHANMGDSNCYRIRIPDDLALEKYACDCYSTTQDTRSMNELGYDVMVKIDDCWCVRNDLRGLNPREIYSRMMRAGLYRVPKLGYLTQHRYKLWAKEVRMRKHTGEDGQWVHIVSKVREPEHAGGYTLKEVVFCNRCGYEPQGGTHTPTCPNCEAVMNGLLNLNSPWAEPKQEHKEE